MAGTATPDTPAHGDSDVVAIWQAMIDAALAEEVAPMLQPPTLGGVID